MNQFRSVKNFFDEFFPLFFLHHSSFIRHILLSFHNLFNGSLRQNQDEERGVSKWLWWWSKEKGREEEGRRERVKREERNTREKVLERILSLFIPSLIPPLFLLSFLTQNSLFLSLSLSLFLLSYPNKNFVHKWCVRGRERNQDTRSLRKKQARHWVGNSVWWRQW